MRLLLNAFAGKCLWFLGLLLLQFHFAEKADAQTTLDFEGISGAQVSTQYNAQGVTFNYPSLQDYSALPGFAHSGTKAVELCYAVELCKSQLVAKFTEGQVRVRIFVGFSAPLFSAATVQLTAFDDIGQVLTTSTATLGASSAPIPVNVSLEVQSPGPRIREIRAGFASADAFNNGLVFDDLTMSRTGPPPTCTATSDPGVVMNEPVSGFTTQINQFRLRGSISTTGPLETATLTIVGPANQQTTSDLLGTIIQPTSASFGPTDVTDSLFEGINTITLRVRNCRGTSQTTSTVIYNPVPQGTQVRLLGMEITQATQNSINSVPLVREKPTLVRLYFSTIGGGPDISSARGDLEGYKQGGNTPFLAQSLGTTTITSSTSLGARRNSLTGSMNFLLSPDFYGPGLLNFRVLRLYVDAPGGATLTCVGCQNWTAQFPDMPRLNLVVQPYDYLKSSKTADVGASLMNGLRFFNNVYPLKGDFPIDDSGIRLILLPTIPLPFDLPDENDRVLCQLQQILDDLKSQPGSGVPPDAYILGVGPSGAGVADFNSKVAYGDSRAIQDTALPTDPEWYGTVWAQELGHAFGLHHVSTSHDEEPPTDPNFPNPHGGIGEPGVAIGTEGWNGTPFLIPPGSPMTGGTHAHDFMSYGTPKDGPDHTNSWVSPYVYTKLRQRILASIPITMSALAPAPADKLVVSGIIDAHGRVTLFPFRNVHTSFRKGSGESGSLTIHLIDGVGRTLSSYQFEPQYAVPGNGSNFNEFVPWIAGTHMITLSRGKTVLATRTVSSAKPIVSAVRARAGKSGRMVSVSWRGTDSDGDKLSYTVLYNSGLDRRWVPVAIDIPGNSMQLNASFLPRSPRARFRVRASDGVNSSEADSPIIGLGSSPPQPAILNVRQGQNLAERSLRLEGAAYDPIDGLLAAGRLRWSSDRDGALGTGRVLIARRISSGRHVITLTATNKRGMSAVTRREVVVR